MTINTFPISTVDAGPLITQIETARDDAQTARDAAQQLVDDLTSAPFEISDTAGLQDALDAKADLVGGIVPVEQLPEYPEGFSGDYADLTGIPGTFPPAAHDQAISTITGLGDALDGKAAASHNHAISEVEELQTALDGKQALSQKGAANGYASLDSAGLVPVAQLPVVPPPAPAYAYAEKTDTATTTSTAFVDTGLSITITPQSATSKILLMAAVSVSGSTAASNPNIVLTDASNAILLEGDVAGDRSTTHAVLGGTAGSRIGGGTVFAVVNAANTAARTYKLRWRTQGGTSFLNRSQTDSNSAFYSRAASTLIALEMPQ